MNYLDLNQHQQMKDERLGAVVSYYVHVCASVCLFVPVFAISKLEHFWRVSIDSLCGVCIYIYRL